MSAAAPSRTRLGVLLVLAWPVVLTRSSQAVIGFADALMTAPLGEEALAAVTTGALNFFALVILPMGIAFIVQSFAAQLAGRGEPLAARRYASYGLILSALMLVLCLAAEPWIGTALGLFPYSDGVRAEMTLYLEIRLLAVAAVVATEVLGNFFAGLGNTALQMRASLIAMVLNVALNWVLIQGRLGAPALGVRGAALASLVATVAGLAYLGYGFARGWVSGLPSTHLALRWGELWRLLRFGVPNGLNWFLEFSAFWLFINAIVAALGTTVLAAMMVVMQINSVSFMPSFGIASAGAILSGQAIGRGRRDDVAGILRLTLGVAACWQGMVGLVYLLAPEPLMRLFAPGGVVEAEMVAVGAVMLALSAGWQLFDAAGITCGEILRSAGDTVWSLWARLLLAWFLFVPAAWLVVARLEGGYVAAILSIIGYLAVLSTVLMLRLRSGAWRRIDLVGEGPVVVG